MDLKEIVGYAVIIAAIAVWGIWRYRENELSHKKDLYDLKRGVEIEPRKRPGWTGVVVTAVVSVLTIGVSIAGMILLNDPFHRSLGVPAILFMLAAVECAVFGFLYDLKKDRETKSRKRRRWVGVTITAVISFLPIVAGMILIYESFLHRLFLSVILFMLAPAELAAFGLLLAAMVARDARTLLRS